MPQNGTERLAPEQFFEVSDHEVREKLSQHLRGDLKEKYRIVSLTWCVNTKKWLIKAVRKADVQQTPVQA